MQRCYEFKFSYRKNSTGDMRGHKTNNFMLPSWWGHHTNKFCCTKKHACVMLHYFINKHPCICQTLGSMSPSCLLCYFSGKKRAISRRLVKQCDTFASTACISYNLLSKNPNYTFNIVPISHLLLPPSIGVKRTTRAATYNELESDTRFWLLCL